MATQMTEQTRPTLAEQLDAMIRHAKEHAAETRKIGGSHHIADVRLLHALEEAQRTWAPSTRWPTSPTASHKPWRSARSSASTSAPMPPTRLQRTAATLPGFSGGGGGRGPGGLDRTFTSADLGDDGRFSGRGRT
jgi:hypothetical protein